MQTDHAARYANQLLASLDDAARVDQLADHPATAWKRSGLLKTTGKMLPMPLASHEDGALMALKAIAPNPDALPSMGSVLLGERARLRETVRQGRWCAGGYGQLLDAMDGRIALNLVRDDDWDLVPAWLEDYITDWDGIVEAVKSKSANDLVERAAEIGLAVSKDALPDRPKSWFTATSFEKMHSAQKPLVVDLSGLWAGPLASSLLQMMGANVIKIEGPDRPDGMRLGHAGFYHLINAGKSCVALNFKDPEQLSLLNDLLEKADIVIEASRPRAFAQLGIRAEGFVARNPGQIWARITAYGRKENRIGFGDDIGVAAGLATVMEQAHGEPCFVGDAIADPVNGLHVALAIWSAYRQGGGIILDFSMREVLRFAMGVIENPEKTAAKWTDIAARDNADLYPMRPLVGRVHNLGEDNNSVLTSLC